jgi:hypothetical protein
MAKVSLEARVSQHDKEIAAIRKLLMQGMKMLVRLEASQQRTEKNLQALIATLKQKNGHGNGRIN